MGRHDVGGRVLFVAAAHHRQRGRGHDKVHQRVGHHRADDRHDDLGVPQQFGAAATRRVALRPRGRLGYVEKGKQAGAQHVDRHHRQVDAEEGHDRQLIGQFHQLRPDQRRGQPPRHDVGNRLWAETVRGGVGGGEAVKALRRHVDTRQVRAEQEDGETVDPQPERRNAGPRGPAKRADGKARAPSKALHRPRQPRCRGHRTEDNQRDRQGCKAGIGCQHLARQPAHDEDHRHLAAQDRLRQHQDAHVAPGTCIVVLGLGNIAHGKIARPVSSR